MQAFIEFLNWGLPCGRFRGIAIRIHVSLILFLLFRAVKFGHIGYGLAFVIGLYLCILLHEFGHAFAARWCDGEANEILLWPLGGLAYTRPAFHPTAYLITSAAGPFVTLLLWLLFSALSWGFTLLPDPALIPVSVLWFVDTMRSVNGWLLLLNLIPAFPLDGGQMLRDLLWRRKGFSDATRIATTVGQVAAIVVAAWGLWTQDFWLVLLAIFVWVQCLHERQAADQEFWRTDSFSLRERMRRGRSYARPRRVRSGDDFHSSRPGVAFNHPYRTLEEEEEARSAPKPKGFFGKLFSSRVRAEAEVDKEEYIRREIDPILDKIAKQGIQSLTHRERKILESAREKLDKRR